MNQRGTADQTGWLGWMLIPVCPNGLPFPLKILFCLAYLVFVWLILYIFWRSWCLWHWDVFVTFRITSWSCFYTFWMKSKCKCLAFPLWTLLHDCWNKSCYLSYISHTNFNCYPQIYQSNWFPLWVFPMFLDLIEGVRRNLLFSQAPRFLH